MLLKMKANWLASINFFLAALLVLAAAGWPFVQEGFNALYMREATAFFSRIEGGETTYKNRNNRYLPFTVDKSAGALKELKISPGDATYCNFAVEVKDPLTLRIVAYLKPDILKKWYLHHPDRPFAWTYERREGEKGKLIL